ncbi:hypothetical protein BS78_10G041100 [Paspalum vaginatum]|nr:hypothetical protein BS78_10G041100 [Paspalum vaginatum]
MVHGMACPRALTPSTTSSFQYIINRNRSSRKGSILDTMPPPQRQCAIFLFYTL